MTINDVDFILYTLGETLCYAMSDDDCEVDDIPQIVLSAQNILLNFREVCK